MDISAARKQPEKLKVLNKESLNNKSHRIAVRINTTLHDTVLNYLSSMHNSTDYSYGSISDILRDILHKMEQKELSLLIPNLQESNHEYIEIMLRVTKQQKNFWQALPYGSRRKIFEKGLLAFTRNIAN